MLSVCLCRCIWSWESFLEGGRRGGRQGGGEEGREGGREGREGGEGGRVRGCDMLLIDIITSLVWKGMVKGCSATGVVGRQAWFIGTTYQSLLKGPEPLGSGFSTSETQDRLDSQTRRNQGRVY